MTDRIYYRPGIDGWIVENRRKIRLDNGDRRIDVAHWYGPLHGWGNTWGMLPDSSVAVFARFEEAAAATRATGIAARRTIAIVSASSAEADRIDELEQRLRDYANGALAHRDDADEIIEAVRDSLDTIKAGRP